MEPRKKGVSTEEGWPRDRMVAPADRARRRADARKRKKETASAQQERKSTDGLHLRGWKLVAFSVMAAIFARYYYWTDRPDPSRPIQEIGAYLLLTDAFHHGQVSLRMRPAPQLLALADPYDPVQNQPYRLHDASLYKGRFYLYFGPTPVIALYLPYLLIFGEFLPDRIGTWLFATGAYILACLLLRLLLQRFWPKTRSWLFFFLCVCLGFSNAFPFLLRRPAIYETAIAAGQFFLMLGLYAIARAAGNRKYPILMAALGGIALAAACGSRPHLGLAIAAAAWLLIPRDNVTVQARFQRIGAVLAPFSLGILLLLVYNYVRFGSLFEFGTHYMLSAFNPRKLQAVDPSRILPNLWLSVLEPPRLASRFPFVVLAPNPPFHLPKDFLGVEIGMGVIWVAPLIILIAVALTVRNKLEAAQRLEWSLYGCILAGLGVAWICVDSLVGSTMRYQADFSAVLFLAVAIVIAGIESRIHTGAGRLMRASIIALGLLGIGLNAAVGITGYYDNLRLEAPVQYQALADWFSPLSKILAGCGVPAERKPAPAVSVD